jgi:hypothetical protein
VAPEKNTDKVKVKIRHGLAYYIDEDGHQYTAFRGQKVDVPFEEAERLKALGAAIPHDEELPMLGRITPLPNTASDEELIAWVSVATKAEVAQAIAEHPALGDRLLNARDIVLKRLEDQNEILSGVDGVVRQGKALAKKHKAAVKRGAPTSGADGKNAKAVIPEDDDDEEDDEDDEEDDLDEDDPASVVKGSTSDISAWLSNHPDQAVAVLEAEKALALDRQREVRPSVIFAVEAAANIANQ